MTGTKRDQERKLKNSRVLNKHELAEEDYEPTIGTSEGLTSMNNPKKSVDARNYAESTDTDYTKP